MNLKIELMSYPWSARHMIIFAETSEGSLYMMKCPSPEVALHIVKLHNEAQTAKGSK